jgi:hypothetical protein
MSQAIEAIKQVKTFYKSAKKARSKFFEVMYQACEAYAVEANHNVLNALVCELDGTGYEVDVQSLVRAIAFHQFDKDANQFSDTISPAKRTLENGVKTTKKEYVQANWLDIYLSWQSSLNNERKAAVSRDPFDLISERLISIKKKADSLDNDQKMKLYLMLMDMASSLK